MLCVVACTQPPSFSLYVQIVTHEQYLKANPLISHNLDELYGNMFESNLLKIIQPYSTVELEHVSKLIKLPVDQVGHCMSIMIC